MIVGLCIFLCYINYSFFCVYFLYHIFYIDKNQVYLSGSIRVHCSVRHQILWVSVRRDWHRLERVKGICWFSSFNFHHCLFVWSRRQFLSFDSIYINLSAVVFLSSLTITQKEINYSFNIGARETKYPCQSSILNQTTLISTRAHQFHATFINLFQHH